MAFVSWFKRKPLWLRAGMVGIAVCLLFFVFYITIYNALLIGFFPDGMLPTYSLILPMVTGHFFVFAAHFVAEGYVVPLLGCMSDDCFNQADWITFVVTAIVLLLVYFLAGTGVGYLYQKRFSR
ncbi:MAG TPA: hypothetical protein VJI32_02340 [Candidatus Nanoarchaeia archaeon]|nr:hypothetical protein [Candidatus Nanoarchaeia archaeon]